MVGAPDPATAARLAEEFAADGVDRPAEASRRTAC